LGKPDVDRSRHGESVMKDTRLWPVKVMAVIITIELALALGFMLR
jgi:hypothetical protein